MNAMRAALTAKLLATPAVVALLGVSDTGAPSIVQEDELAATTPLPAIALAFDGHIPRRRNALFREQRFDLFLASETGDYYTLGRLAEAVQDALDEASLDPPNPGDPAGLEVILVWSGKAYPEPALAMHLLPLRFRVTEQRILTP
jgi:hypothetical protein